MGVCVHTYIQIYIYTHIRIYTYKYVHIYIHAYIHIYISTYIHIYIYVPPFLQDPPQWWLMGAGGAPNIVMLKQNFNTQKIASPLVHLENANPRYTKPQPTYTHQGGRYHAMARKPISPTF